MNLNQYVFYTDVKVTWGEVLEIRQCKEVILKED